jgi:hypothetical protein
MTAVYTNEIRYEFNQHEVRLTFFDKATAFDGPYASPIHVQAEEVARLAMTRQTFRAFLQILTQVAEGMPPIGIPDPADRDLPAEMME